MTIRTLAYTILFILIIAPPAQGQESITLTNGYWPPFFSSSFKYGGIGSRICSEAFAEAGIEVNYVYMPWKRSLLTAKKGDFEGSVGWRKTPETERAFYFSDPILMGKTVFFHKRGKQFNWETLDDIGHLRVGGTLGYVYKDLLLPIAEKNGGKYDEALTDKSNLQKLAAGRIDIFPCEEAVGYYLLRSQMLPGTADLIKHHPKSLLERDLCLVISKKTPNGKELIKRFNKGLAKIKADGRYDQFMIESVSGDYMPKRPKQ